MHAGRTTMLNRLHPPLLRSHASRAGSRQRGVSLIEALVALAVMAFGMLGMLGLQATLRTNADLTRQRAEAVRIAQAEVERLRGFESVTASPGLDFTDIVSVLPAAVLPPAGAASANTAYRRTATVLPAALTPSTPKFKTVTMDVQWEDRSGQTSHVLMVSSMAAVDPALAGSLALAGDRTVAQRPRNRNRAIPPGAVDQGNGTSTFAPPNAAGVSWVFNNVSGVITQVCAPACSNVTLLLLRG